MQRMMEKRYLNVYLLKDQGRFNLRFIEVQRKEKEDEVQDNWSRIREANKPRFDHVWSDVHNKLNFEYIDYVSTSMKSKTGISDHRSIVTYHNEPYEYNEVNIPLSSDPALLMRQLGPLDGALFYYQKFNRLNGCKIRFASKADDFSSPIGLIYTTLSNKDDDQPKKAFTRVVAEWIMSEAEKKPHQFAEYQYVIPVLSELLSDESPSLAYPVIKKCYPGYDFEDSRIKTALESDPLKAAVFAEDKNYEEKEKLVLTWLRSKLHPKLAEQGAFSSVLGMFAGATQKGVEPSKEINNWFANLKAIQRHMWYKKIESLTGQLSFEGGAYALAFNPVIGFLRDVSLTFNADGLMVLDASKLESSHHSLAFDFEAWMNSHEDLDEPARNPSFERELRHAFKLLGLEFMPGIDFYGSTSKPNLIYPFTPASTVKLMDWGFHITKEHCQRLLKASHDYGALEMFLQNSEGLPPVPVALRPKIMKSAEPYLPPEDLQSMYRLRIGSK